MWISVFTVRGISLDCTINMFTLRSDIMQVWWAYWKFWRIFWS